MFPGSGRSQVRVFHLAALAPFQSPSRLPCSSKCSLRDLPEGTPGQGILEPAPLAGAARQLELERRRRASFKLLVQLVRCRMPPPRRSSSKLRSRRASAPGVLISTGQFDAFIAVTAAAADSELEVQAQHAPRPVRVRRTQAGTGSRGDSARAELVVSAGR